MRLFVFKKGNYLKDINFRWHKFSLVQIFEIDQSKTTEFRGISFRGWAMHCEFCGIYFHDSQIQKIIE